MSIAIIISTHGSAAEQLLKTTEMILGIQDNVACINFIHGENAELLEKKYKDYLSKLDITKGLLFFVDTWGGTPFNAATNIVNNKENYEIITGVNIPMLIEVFLLRDENPSFHQLINVAVNAGHFGIKVFLNKDFNKKLPTSLSSSSSSTKSTSSTKLVNTNNTHMEICLARIDDRLIHGQVVTSWTKKTKIQRIIVVSDEVASDQIRKTLLTQVAPPGITAHVVDIAKAIRVYNNAQYAKDRVMLLFTNPTDVLRLVENGVKITSVNIGGMAYYKDKKQINNAISVNNKDIEAFKKLHQLGIELEIRKVSSDISLNMMDLLKKI